MSPPKFWSYFFSRAIYGAGAVALLGLVASLLIFYTLNRAESDRARDLLLSRTTAADPILIKSVEQHLDRLDNVGDVFALRSVTNRAEFRAAADALMQKYPAYEGVSWAPVIRPEEQKRFEEDAQHDLDPSFRLHRADSKAIDPTQVIWPILYSDQKTSPGKGLERGLELSSSALAKTMREAQSARRTLLTAAQNGIVTAVCPVFAVKESDVHPASSALVGFVLAQLNVQTLVEEARNEVRDNSTDILVIDSTPGEAKANQLLFPRSADVASAHAIEADFRSKWYREEPVLAGGRVWLALSRGNAAWLSAQRTELPLILSLVGVVLTVFLTILVFNALRSAQKNQQRVTASDVRIQEAADQLEALMRERDESVALLQSSQEQLHALLENSPSAIFMKDVQGRYITVNRRYAEMHGRSRENFVGKSDLDLFPPEVASRLRLSDARVLSSGKAIELEDTMALPQGTHTSIIHKFPLMDQDGNIHGLCGIATDISERKRAEAEIRESRRQLESMLGQLPGMAFRYVNDGQFTPVYVSRGAVGLTGYSARDFIEGLVKLESVIHPDDREHARVAIASAVRKRRSFEVEYRLIDRSGREKWVLERGQGVYDEEGKLLFVEGLAIDITQRKDAESEKLLVERRLLEGQKLESIGVLAGGIAHDFNNLLTGIMGNANLAALEISPNSRVQQNLKQIEIASQRAAELCQQMLAYAGKGRFVVQRVELGSLVESTVPLLRASISKKAELHFDLETGLPSIVADPTQMRQIVMNLVINASEALGEQDGEIFITTRLVRPTADYFGGAALTPPELNQDFVLFQVRDTGCGMSAETLAKIFDPFFTTKFAGRGLGLAAVQGIIRSHKGGLKVTSSPGAGATFTLLFPVTGGATEANPTRRTTSTPWRQEGLALIIDDEDHVRGVTEGMLHSCGMRTESARDGYEGVDLFRAKPHEFDVVVLDMTMPRLTGEETLQYLREVRPDVRVLFMSGYNRREVVDTLAGSGVLSFIQKPFTLDGLREQLKFVLSQA
jgi:PAS domain S-box-containing protein